ncbi:hypothetical protein HW532_12755 [Kaustia mangrovi]|uniref:Uncharacterized protein n=1 Tax=Kaustia mangrovi TaxID=2593653 RepID=A0A7S8C4Y3_9HYPH|nr:hypothetical protein [Kaustia mangrovi]QPC43487.1 hypothetical protein HW532_12755 [Kaustia mangrovi]
MKIVGGIVILAGIFVTLFTPVLALASGVSVIISGVFLIAFGALMEVCESIENNLSVIASQLRSQTGFRHTVANERHNITINGFPAKRLRGTQVAIDTSIGELHFATAHEAQSWIAEPAQEQRDYRG